MTPEDTFMKNPLTILLTDTKPHSVWDEIQTEEDTGVEILVEIYRLQIN